MYDGDDGDGGDGVGDGGDYDRHDGDSDGIRRSIGWPMRCGCGQQRGRPIPRLKQRFAQFSGRVTIGIFLGNCPVFVLIWLLGYGVQYVERQLGDGRASLLMRK